MKLIIIYYMIFLDKYLLLVISYKEKYFYNL